MTKAENKPQSSESHEDTYGYPQKVWKFLSDYQRRMIASLHKIMSHKEPIDPELQQKIDKYHLDER